MSKSKKASKTAVNTKPQVKIAVGEKRSVNFFVRIKPQNAVWMKEQAKLNKANTSVFADSLIERLRAGENVKTL